MNQQVTHLVVKEGDFPFVERLVPISSVTESTSTLIRLRCTRAELASMESFIETEYLTGDGPYAGYATGQYWLMPYGLPEMVAVPLQHERVPPGELAVHRGASVVATDGRVGRVDEFLVDPKTEHITHLVLREGHLWGQKDVSIPVSQIDHIEEDAVYLKLDKQSIQDLPHIPIKRPMRESTA
ncbi:MAG: PRC-barrel domain-containing protein [Chloroflexi bacterium]|nr:PRC-barrel domain-containing protein [Chloroflexota bacterium]